MVICNRAIYLIVLSSELVINKEDTPENVELPDIIPITNEESKAEKQDLWAIHEKDLKVR